MLLYDVYEIGSTESSKDIPLPKVGKKNEFAACTNGQRIYYTGTGTGWKEITADEFRRLLETVTG